ncbi:MAG: hypothetical protein RW306_17800 [Geobacteraceae bacterium]|nr:hypothetical protein [Geobacteraceae bacterium]
MQADGWIGVDLDGTLAEFHGWINMEHIGAPVPEMAERVRTWLDRGVDVRIFTARVDSEAVALSLGNETDELFSHIEKVRSIIQDWTEKHLGHRLPVTNVKDFKMIELWDDRAVRVVLNKGCPCCEHSR